MASQEIKVEGLRELQKALGRVDKEIKKDLMRELKGIGNRVADRARQNATPRSKTGKELRGIKASARSGKRTAGVSVVSKAREPASTKSEPGGYRYTKLHEYGGGARIPGKKGSLPGPRAVLNPAIEQLRGRSERDIERVINNFVKEF